MLNKLWDRKLREPTTMGVIAIVSFAVSMSFLVLLLANVWRWL